MRILKLDISLRHSMIFFILVLASLLLFRRLSMFILLILLAGGMVYLNYHIRLPFDISPVLFLSLVITREYGFVMSCIFILASGIVPMVLAGGTFDHTTLFYLSLIMGVNFVFGILSFLPFTAAAIGAILVHHIIAALAGIALLGGSPGKEYLNLMTKIVVDLTYILTLSDFIFLVIG